MKAPTTREIIGPGRTAVMSTLLWFLVLWSVGLGPGSAAQEQHCGPARGEFQFHNNSRQGHIMMTESRLHAEDAAVCTENWYGGSQPPDYSGHWHHIYIIMFKSCSPRQTALRDALLMVSGAPVQRVSQTSLHNLLTLEAEEEQPKNFTFIRWNPISCFLLTRWKQPRTLGSTLVSVMSVAASAGGCSE